MGALRRRRRVVQEGLCRRWRWRSENESMKQKAHSVCGIECNFYEFFVFHFFCIFCLCFASLVWLCGATSRRWVMTIERTSLWFPIFICVFWSPGAPYALAPLFARFDNYYFCRFIHKNG